MPTNNDDIHKMWESGKVLLAHLRANEVTQHQYTLALLDRGRTDSSDNHIFAYLSNAAVDTSYKKEVLAGMIQRVNFHDRVFSWGKAFFSDEAVSGQDKVEIALYAISHGIVYQGVGLFNDQTLSIADKVAILMAVLEKIKDNPYQYGDYPDFVIQKFLQLSGVNAKDKQAVMQRYISCGVCDFSSAAFRVYFNDLSLREKASLLSWLGAHHDFEKRPSADYQTCIQAIIDTASSDCCSHDARMQLWGRAIALDQRLNRRKHSHRTSDDEEFFRECSYHGLRHAMPIVSAISAIRQGDLGKHYYIDDDMQGIILRATYPKSEQSKHAAVNITQLLAYAIRQVWRPTAAHTNAIELQDEIRHFSHMLHDRTSQGTSMLRQMLINCPYLIVLLPKNHTLRHDKSLIKVLLGGDGRLLALLTKAQRNDPEYVAIATKQNAAAWSYVGERRIDALLLHDPLFLATADSEKAYLSLTIDKQLQTSYILQLLKSEQVDKDDLIRHVGVLVKTYYPLVQAILFAGMSDSAIEKRLQGLNPVSLGKVLLAHDLGIAPDLSITDERQCYANIEAFHAATNIDVLTEALSKQRSSLQSQDVMAFFDQHEEGAGKQSKVQLPLGLLSDFLLQSEQIAFEKARRKKQPPK